MNKVATEQQQELWDKLNDKQKQFVVYRLQKMPRIDAYMKAYGQNNRDSARKHVSRLMTTNGDIKAILDDHFDDCIVEAKEILREESTDSARAIALIRDIGNREYMARLQAAIFNLKAVGADVPSRVQVEQTGDTAPGLVIIGIEDNYPPPLDSSDDGDK